MATKASLKSVLQRSHADYFNALCDSIVTLEDDSNISGAVHLSGMTGLSAGSGFSDAALYKSWRSELGSITKTELLID